MIGILLALGGPGEIQVAPQPVRDRKVGLLDASEHLLIELLLKRVRGSQNGVGVGVLRFKVGNDLRRFFVAKPVVMVDAAVAVEDMLYGFAPGNGRGGR